LLFGIGGNGFGGEAVGVDGNGPRLAESAETTGVVAVFVGEDDAIDLFEIATNEREPLRDLATTQARVNKESRRVGFNQCAIAGAATPQNRDVHPHGSDSTRSGDGLKLSAWSARFLADNLSPLHAARRAYSETGLSGGMIH
jgi:hypothetical protein